MNDEAAPQGRPDRQHHRQAEDSSACGRDVLTRVVSIRELVHYGARYVDGSLPADVVSEVDRRLERLEDDLGRVVTPTAGRRCEQCGLSFDWPGLLVQHVLLSHPPLENELAA